MTLSSAPFSRCAQIPVHVMLTRPFTLHLMAETILGHIAPCLRHGPRHFEMHIEKGLPRETAILVPVHGYQGFSYAVVKPRLNGGSCFVLSSSVVTLICMTSGSSGIWEQSMAGHC